MCSGFYFFCNVKLTIVLVVVWRLVFFCQCEHCAIRLETVYDNAQLHVLRTIRAKTSNLVLFELRSVKCEQLTVH